MKKLKIILILGMLLNCSAAFAQGYVASIKTGYSRPMGSNVRYRMVRVNFKVYSGGSLVGSYENMNDQGAQYSQNFSSAQPITRIVMSLNVTNSTSTGSFRCEVQETITLSGNDINCFKRTYRNGDCSIDVSVVGTQNLLTQPVNDTFCLDDGLTFTRINDCTNASYQWFYNIDNSGNFRDTGVRTVGGQAVVIPFKRLIPSSYRGSIRLRARVTVGRASYNTNIIIFRTLPCAPEIRRIDPISASCGRSNGGLRITFNDPVNQEMAFVVRRNGRPIESSQQYVSGSSYTWPSNKGLASGTYTLTYQIFPGEVIDYRRSFTIGDSPKVNFSAVKNTDLQCFGQNIGRITITASRGNGRYQYKVNGGSWRNFSSGNRHVLTGLSRGNYRIEVQDTSGCIGETNSGNVGENVFVNGPIDGVTFSNIRVTPVTFRGDSTGAINLVVSGGTKPYTYSWSNGDTSEDISQLAAGFYTLTVIDGKGCNFSSSPIQVTEPDALGVNIAVNQVVSCNDNTNGVLEAIPSGGIASAGYQYQWTKVDDPSFSRTTKVIDNLSAGTYSVSLSNIGAPSTSDTETLINPAPLSFSGFDVRDILCFGDRTGSIRFTISGGRPPYTVNWDNGVTEVTSGVVAFINQPKGVYNFEILDTENCSITNDTPIIINEEDEIRINVSGLGIQGPTSVNGTNGAIDVEVVGGTGTYTYEWTSDQFSGVRTTEDLSNLTEGNYKLTVRDTNNCIKIRDFKLKDPEPLEVYIQVDEDILCFGQKASLTAIVQGGVTNSAQSYSYQWYSVNSGVSTELVGETNQTITGLEEGVYEVRATDIVGIFKTSNEQGFIEPTEIILGGTHVDVFCNGGNNGSIDLTATGGTGVLTYLWSKEGDLLFSSTDQDINNLTSGIYKVQVRDENLVCVKEKTFEVIQPDNPLEIVDFSKENVKIFGQSTGSISITVSGGTPNYTYKWTKDEDPNFVSTEEDLVNITVGNYTVEISDANVETTTSNTGCMTSMEFEITQPDKLEVDIAIEKPLDCYGFLNGSLRANAIGGIEDQDYTYRWYKIEENQEVEITENTSLSYIENIGNGTYKVIVKDINGAIAEDIFDFKEPNKIVVSLLGKTDVKCFGESTGNLQLNITGGTPFDDNTYMLQLYRDSNFYTDGFYPVGDVQFVDLPSGDYDIIVQDKNGCPEIEEPESMKIIQPEAALEISDVEKIDLTGFETQNGKITITVSGGTPEYKYEWRVENDTNIIAEESTIDNLPIGSYEVTVIDANDCKTIRLYELVQPDKLEVTVDYPNIGGQVSCNGTKDAILEATVTGGVPFDNNTKNPYYQYQWYSNDNPSIIIGENHKLEDVGKGSYGVIITDANANVSRSLVFEVEEPPVITINIIRSIDVTCFNDATGSISVEVLGGTPFDDGGYLYNWSNGSTTKDIANLLGGNYALTVTDRNGCQMSTETIVISEPNGPLTITNITRVPSSSSIARDGSITVDVTSGTPPYTYSWFDSNGAQYPSTTNKLDNTGNGEYFITITDANGCVIERRNVDTPISGLSVEIIQINPVLCQGSNTASLRANVSGGIPFSANDAFIYTWYQEGSPNTIGKEKVLYELPIGNYYVVIEDALGNSVQSEVYSIEGPPTKLEVTLTSDYINCGDQNDWNIIANVQGGLQPYTYFWQDGLGNNQELVNVPSGTYTLIVQDARGCIAQTSTTTFEPISLTANIFGTNPLCYQGKTGKASVEPIGGVPPYTYVWNTGATTSDISNIPEGDYLVEVKDSKGCTIIKEITLTDPDKTKLDIGPERKILCLGQTYTIDASIDDPNATYRWTSDMGFESSEAKVTLSDEANYQIEITTNLGCVVRENLTIIVRENPLIAEFLLSSDVFVNKTFVLANVSYPVPDRVEWELPEEAQIINIDDTYAEIQFDKTGEYKVSMTAYHDGCQETFSEKIVVRDRSTSTGDDTGNFLKNFTIYPIPTDGDFTMKIAFKKEVPISFNIYSLVSNKPVLGTPYRDEGNSEYSIPMNLKDQNLPTGVYFIILEIPGERYIHKVIVE